MSRVGIIGIGICGQIKRVSKLSSEEMIIDATNESYNQAGIANDDVDEIIEHTANSNCDSIAAIGNAYTHIKKGLSQTVLVKSFSKVSNTDNSENSYTPSLDSIFAKELGISYMGFIGLFHQKVINDLKFSEEDTGLVSIKNKTNALKNSNGIYGEKITLDDYIKDEYVAYPSRKKDISNYVDYACAVVLASEEKIKKMNCQPYWIESISWINGTYNIAMELENYYNSLRKLYKNMEEESSLLDLISEVDIYEIDDTYSFLELINLSVIGYNDRVSKLMKSNYFNFNGEKPVNVSGGSLGCGNSFDTTGIFRLGEAIKQLKNNSEFTRALVSSYRGFPSQSFAGLIIKK